MTKPTPASRPLNPRQSRFVDEYLRCGNARDAAEWAGYRRTQARKAGHDLMRLPNVRAAIEAGMAARDNPLTRSALLLEASRVAFANIADYLQLRDGQPVLDLTRATHAKAAGFREFRMVETYRAGASQRRIHIRLGDKMAALRLLLAHLGTAEGEAEVAAMARAEAARLAAIDADHAPSDWVLAEADSDPAAQAAAKTAKGAGQIGTGTGDHRNNGRTRIGDHRDSNRTGAANGAAKSPVEPAAQVRKTRPPRPPQPREEAWIVEMRQELSRLERGLTS